MTLERITHWVRRAQVGDDAAFAELVRAYQDISVAYATSILRDYDLAEDAVQDALVDAFRLLPTLRDPAAFGGWLRTLVFKHCDRIIRRAAYRTIRLDDTVELADPDASPHEQLESREARNVLRAAIGALPESEREVVLLYYMGDESQASIAAFLGISTNTVKTRLYSARRRLKKEMADVEQDLRGARPSNDPAFVERVVRLIQPEALKQSKPWPWSPGIGVDVWKMFIACITGDLEEVKRLVAQDPSLIRSHYEYRTPLSFAVRNNQLAVAEYLLDHGAGAVKLGDPREWARDRGLVEMEALLDRKLGELHGASGAGDAVAAAIREYDIPKVLAMIDASPELLNAGDRESDQPIHWATKTRQIPLIDALLERGADVNAARGDGARPIHLVNGDYGYRGWQHVPDHVTTTPNEVYRHLLARGATIDVWMAAATGDVDRVRALIDEDPRLVNRQNEYNSYYVGSGSALKNAAAAGHLDIVRLLLDRGADPNLPQEGIAPNGNALYSAIYNGHYEIAKLLLEHGANPDAPVESSADAVWIAIRRGELRIVELLAKYGATWEIPIDPTSPLTYDAIVGTGLKRSAEVLAYFNDTVAAAELFARDPAAASSPGALGQAAGRGHEAFVHLLLARQPDLAKSVMVSRPRAMAELLFAHGMDPNRPSWTRRTPLHHFATDGDVEAAALYLDHGADIEAREEEDCSRPLAIAAREGRTRMVEFLLRRGAKPRVNDDPAWATPMAWATRRGHDEIVQLLTTAERGELPTTRLEQHDARASELVAAYAGDADAMGRIIDFFDARRQALWDRPSPTQLVARLRGAVQQRLGRAGPPPPALSLADARLLVARAVGYADWEALKDSLD